MPHSRPGRIAAATATAALLTLTTACGGGGSGGADDGTPSGEILVLTNRTDVVDTVFQDYKAAFEEQYPDVTVEFEALTDYEGEVKTRMSTDDYGDVLLIPAGVTIADYPDFFEPLGTTEELGQEYRFVEEAAVDGTAYGLATFGNANGMVYNRDVFEQAGITEPPTSPEEFIADLQAIADSTDAVPFYTNYKDGWPLSWPQNFMGSVSGDPEAGVRMTEADAPWAEGEEKAALDSLLYDVAAAGLIEDDPTTTNWESSKNLLATGQVGVMALGSWSIPQMQAAAEEAGADPSVIGYLPPPFQVDGQFTVPVGGDFKLGINVNSEHKSAARAWVDFFVGESGFSEFAGGLPTVADQPAPATLTEFEASGVQYLEMTPTAVLSSIDDESEIGVTQADYYRTLVDSARGASDESKEQIFEDLNGRWAEARASVG